jgi:hypothetical protein
LVTEARLFVIDHHPACFRQAMQQWSKVQGFPCPTVVALFVACNDPDAVRIGTQFARHVVHTVWYVGYECLCEVTGGM